MHCVELEIKCTFDIDGYNHYLRSKISLENKLMEIGNIPGSLEIESQIMFAEERLVARIKQAYNHSAKELLALRQILNETAKRDKDE